MLNVSIEDTQKKLDKALKRNVGGIQASQTTSATQKVVNNDLPTEETPINESDEPDPIDE